MGTEGVRRTARREGMTGGARKNSAETTKPLYPILNYCQVVTISGVSARGCGNQPEAQSPNEALADVSSGMAIISLSEMRSVSPGAEFTASHSDPR
jgi:hypothetical protein